MAALLEAKKVLLPNASKHIEIRKHFNNISKKHRLKYRPKICAAGLNQRVNSNLLIATCCWADIQGPAPRCWSRFWTRTLNIVSAEETLIFRSKLPAAETRKSTGNSVLEILNGATPELLNKSHRIICRSLKNFSETQIGDRLLIDKNPSQTAQIPAVVRIFPQTKFLVALRDREMFASVVLCNRSR